MRRGIIEGSWDFFNLCKKTFILTIISLLVTSYILLHQCQLSLILSIFLFFLFLVPIATIISTRIHLLNPLLIFSTYYYILILSIPISINKIEPKELEKVAVIVMFSYLFFSIGFLLFANRSLILSPRLKVSSRELPTNITKITMFFLFSIGIMNYFFVLYKTVNFRIWEYYSNLGFYGRNLKEIFGLSTLGYLSLHPAIYIAIYEYVKGSLNKYILYLLCIAYVLIMLSLAKITYFVLQMIILLYVYLILKRDISLSIKRLSIMLLFAVIALLLFFYRMLADIARVKGYNIMDLVPILMSPETISSILFEKSNLPNVNIIVFIMEHWGEDINFLYGLSLLNIMSGFMPSFIRDFMVHNFSVSWIIKNKWFIYAPGGSIPPTIIGELLANFGYLGIFFMFLLGAITAIVYNRIFRSPTYPKVIFYSYFLWKFVFLLAKGEFSRISDLSMVVSVLVISFLKSLRIFNIKTKTTNQ